MTDLAPRHRYTFTEYLEIEEISSVRHEFYAGEIYAMAGGTPEHAAMAAAITALLGRQLEGGACRAYSSDLRVRIVATGLATYPDVTVICGKSERDPESATHVTNPKVVIEVLSPGTEEYDRGEKLQHYQQVASLEAIVLVDHRTVLVELWTRQEDGWARSEYGAGQTVAIEAISCELPVDPVYAAARNA
jgi:Uma2 family endonuclease